MTAPDRRQGNDSSQVFYVRETAVVLAAREEPGAMVIELELAHGRPLGHQPGQFVQVSVFGYGEAPISVCSSPLQTSSFELCIQPKGNVSRAIVALEPGEWVGIRGPYGTVHFPLKRMHNRDILLVAGGIGLAPLRGLIHYICANRRDCGSFRLVCGANSPDAILFRNELERWQDDPDIDLHLTVDKAAGTSIPLRHR